MSIHALKLPVEMEGEAPSKRVREALTEIAGSQTGENKGSYHFAFYCDDALFEKAQEKAKARRVSLSYWVSELLSEGFKA